MKKIYITFIFTALFSFFVTSAQADTTLVYTGSMQTVVIPPCVFSIDIDIAGAAGGGNPAIAADGGLGGRVQATMAVTPGQTLYVFIGGTGDVTGTPGYNGGGLGAGGSLSNPGSGGGGASDIRINGTALTDRVIVAGGGGGGTENGGLSVGGAGGGLVGAMGSVGGNPWGCTPLNLATGGTQSAGGLGGTSGSCAWDGTNGTFGIGGDAYPVYRCAGGGGGWYGGGGAHNGCSGAGGSSYTEPSMTNVTHTQGYQAGNGMVIINYNIGPPAPGAITGSGSLCEGASANYSIAPMPGVTSYTWSVPAGTTINSGQGTTSISITAGNTSGNISVYATDVCGNSPAVTIALTILPAPVVSGSATDSTVCTGSSTTVSGSGALNYSWSGGVTDGVPFVPSTSTTYTVTGTDASGCTATATLLITVAPLPTVSLGADITQCGGGAILDAGNAGSTYLWNDSSTSQTLVLSSSGTYYVDVTDPLGCIGTDTIVIIIHTPPSVVASAASNLVCLDDDSVALFGSPSGGTWSGTGVFGSTFSPSAAGAGTYSLLYSYTDVNACVGQDTTTIVVDVCLGTTEPALDNPVSAFPNPNNGTLTVAINADMGDMTIEIMDMQGRVVYSSSENNVQSGFTKQIILENVSDGIYMMRIATSHEQVMTRIVIQK